jgi:hypothetical protein
MGDEIRLENQSFLSLSLLPLPFLCPKNGDYMSHKCLMEDEAVPCTVHKKASLDCWLCWTAARDGNRLENIFLISVSIFFLTEIKAGSEKPELEMGSGYADIRKRNNTDGN